MENGTTGEVKKIVETLNAGKIASTDVVEVMVSPPYVFLTSVKSELRPEIQVAAQNCWVKKGGPSPVRSALPFETRLFSMLYHGS
ncbi:triosephosphate isomerase, cytosolic-like [Silene latifolia]|uniref:triosephosphate isomerase, cytosolic-like n=1 Tax=Silene latifolia TaxID=37657 RepID=UPI003D777DB3